MPYSSWRMRPVQLPTLPKPWMAAVACARSRSWSSAHDWMQYTVPRPVASSRPKLPPEATLLPVTTCRATFFVACALVFMYVSIIQTMCCALVPMSGAGMS